MGWDPGHGSRVGDSSRYVAEALSRRILLTEVTPWVAALEFRRFLGGEKRITEYCHALAVSGGRTAAEVLGTEVVETANGELTANMVRRTCD